MFETLIQKFEPRFALSDSDNRALEQANSLGRFIQPRGEIIAEGDTPDHIHVIRSGLACRTKVTSDGERAILGFLIPGDICDLSVPICGAIDHTVSALTKCEVTRIPHSVISRLTAEYPSLDRILRWVLVVDQAILREWMFIMGRFAADKQVAHLMCEFLYRFRFIGLGTDNSFELPLTQSDLSDALGLSPVHLNRTLQKLRQAKLIVLRGRYVFIPDVDALVSFASFNPSYLNLEWRPADRLATS